MGAHEAPEVDLLVVRRRLAEAIAWCAARAGTGEPGDVLWAPALRPPGIGERPPWAAMPAASRPPWLRDFPVHERTGIVEELARARAEALDASGRAPMASAEDLAGGRLVLVEPDSSVDDGASEHVSRGFFDVGDMPAWDTWVCYVLDPGRAAATERWRAAGAGPSAGEIGFGDYLVAWVPPVLVDLVDKGIDYNPVECITWADAVDTAFTRRLRAAGIM
jgi:hypothetical protein